MSKPSKRFIGKAVDGKGWRIWNVKQKKWWGEFYKCPQEALLKELNEEKRSELLNELIKKASAQRSK